jgi:hypothetical protein
MERATVGGRGFAAAGTGQSMRSGPARVGARRRPGRGGEARRTPGRSPGSARLGRCPRPVESLDCERERVAVLLVPRVEARQEGAQGVGVPAVEAAPVVGRLESSANLLQESRPRARDHGVVGLLPAGTHPLWTPQLERGCAVGYFRRLCGSGRRKPIPLRPCVDAGSKVPMFPPSLAAMDPDRGRPRRGRRKRARGSAVVPAGPTA